MKRSEQLLAHAAELHAISGMIPQDAGWDRLKSAERAALAVAEELQAEEAAAVAAEAKLMTAAKKALALLDSVAYCKEPGDTETVIAELEAAGVTA